VVVAVVFLNEYVVRVVVAVSLNEYGVMAGEAVVVEA